jgi:hypothetical protein
MEGLGKLFSLEWLEIAAQRLREPVVCTPLIWIIYNHDGGQAVKNTPRRFFRIGRFWFLFLTVPNATFYVQNGAVRKGVQVQPIPNSSIPYSTQPTLCQSWNDLY